MYHCVRYFSQHKSPPSLLGAVSGMGSADKLQALVLSVFESQNQNRTAHRNTQNNNKSLGKYLKHLLA